MISAPLVRVSGRYILELLRKSGTVKLRVVSKNLVVDSGLDRLGSGTTSWTLDTQLSHVAVGTSNVAPANSDTALGNEIERTSDNGGFADTTGTDPAFAYAWAKRTR